MEATIKETALKDMEATLHKTLLEATMKESTLQESIKSVRLTMISNQIGQLEKEVQVGTAHSQLNKQLQ
jgi:hypothetical protein